MCIRIFMMTHHSFLMMLGFLACSAVLSYLLVVVTPDFNIFQTKLVRSIQDCPYICYHTGGYYPIQSSYQFRLLGCFSLLCVSQVYYSKASTLCYQ